MFNLKSAKRKLAQVRLPDSLRLWHGILEVAVTSNSYPDAVRSDVLHLLKTGGYVELFRMADAMSQQVYETPMLHYRMHQLAALIRKYPVPEQLSGMNPKRAAMDTFLAAEHRCKRVNQRFRAGRTTGRLRYGSELTLARDWIAYVIGLYPHVPSIISACDITPGAAIGVHGNATNLARKLSSPSWTVSHGAYNLALQAVWGNPHWREYLLSQKEKGHIVCLDKANFVQLFEERVQVVPYNNISFVPKTAKTHRSIAVEPFLNSFVQRGVDTVLRDRLRRVGLDLSDQATNGHMARLGSLDSNDGYCTIDLSSASDTLATEVVFELLPPEWCDLLCSLRSSQYKWTDGTLRKYHKFVSMGNGFCFPLQTLIFSSLCHAASRSLKVESDFRVYGDDIIVRKCVAQKVLDLLDYCGFVPNSRKTFTSGPFRESCGLDWHGGVNVRPIYLDHPLDTLERIFGFHNQSLRRESYVQLYFQEIREYLWKQVPANARLVDLYDPSYLHLPTDQPQKGDLGKWSGTTIDGAFWVPQDRFMVSPYVCWSRDEQRWRSLALRSQPVPDKRFNIPRDGEGSLLHMIGALRGSRSVAPFTLRYSTRTKAVIL